MLDNAKSLLEYWELASAALVLAATIYTGWLWLRGIAPVLIRLGRGLSRRKIAIFAKGDACESLASLLQDSTLFRRTNLVCIRALGDFGKAETSSIFLVHYPDWSPQEIQQVLGLKRDATALIVYAPPGNGLSAEMMARINEARNATLVNLRGRLLNDVMLSMITTSYEKN